ncbi:MAG: copper(I)-binding protein, partial [Motiliproteus sp.]
MNNLASAMLLGIGVALSSLMAQADITVEQGYVRASPPGMSTGAAFMTLH